MVASIVQWVEDNSQALECIFYEEMMVRAYGAAVKSLFTGQFWLAGGMAAVGAATTYTWSLAGCGGDPPPPPPSGGDNCWKVATCEQIWTYYNNTWSIFGIPSATEILSFTLTPQGENQNLGSVRFINCEGNEQTYNWSIYLPDNAAVSFRDVPCEGKEPSPPPPEHNPGEPISAPYQHTDPDGCNWTIQATDAYVDDQGLWHTYYTITADNDACGGPFAYWSTEGGKKPDWVQPTPDDPDGNPQPPAPPKDYNPRFDDIDEKLDDIKKELDEVKDCACDDPKPELLGDWISIRFVSDGISPNGTAPLRKLFRYRSQSSRTEQQLRDYWAGFTWQAGPVIVQHKGTWWGTPQVWASSAEEGKRVLRFAAGEAGASPDTDGEWIVTGSASPRYGMSGTMRIQQYRGRDWVTQRIGPSGPVEL